MRMNNGGSLRTWGQWVQFGIDAKRDSEIVELNERPKQTIACGNVVGGSLDGATIPSGTHNGQRLVWDASRQRWIG